MIKGINRQMIEITHTDSPYFERAFLLLRPQAAQASPDTLELIARRVVQQADSYTGLRRTRLRRWLSGAITFAVAAAIGAVGMWLALNGT